MAKKVLVTGSTGYIGGSLAVGFVEKGYSVYGLLRSAERSKELELLGIKPVLGTLSNSEALSKAASDVDIVINAASSDHSSAVHTFISALKGSGKIFIQNSGSTVVCKSGVGSKSEEIFDEEKEFEPAIEKQERVKLDKFVVDSSSDALYTAVVCPCLIYGEGLGLKKESAQVPAMVRQALKSQIARYIGEGTNIWSTVHIKDLVDLYLKIAENPRSNGKFYFAEHGEIDFKSIAVKIRESLELKEKAQSWSLDEAYNEWGEGMAKFALASNSRIRANAAKQLDWNPKFDCVLEDVERTCKSLSAISIV